MKKINKFTCIASVLAMLTSAAALPVSAEVVNDYSVSYETLSQAVTADDGTVIPAGSVAVTMTVSNNTGFNANTLTLDIEEGYTAIINDEGKPVVQTGSVLDGAHTSAKVSSDCGKFCMAVASSTLCAADGILFTTYLTGETNTEAIAVVNDVEPMVAVPSSAIVGESLNVTRVTERYYYVGDTNGLEEISDKNYPIINALDATNILIAYSAAGEQIKVSAVNAAKFFPSAVFFGAPDANRDNFINEDDSDEILEYCACAGAGEPYTGDVGTERKYYTNP